MNLFEVFEKATTGTDPEHWEPVDDYRRVRLSVRALSDGAALQVGVRLQTNVTHVARGDHNDVYRRGRLLRDVDSDARWLIEEVRETGRARRGRGHTARVRLGLVEWTGWDDAL